MILKNITRKTRVENLNELVTGKQLKKVKMEINSQQTLLNEKENQAKQKTENSLRSNLESFIKK